MLEWLTNRRKLALAEDNASRKAERAEHWMTIYYECRAIKDRLDLELSASVGQEIQDRLDVERLQAHAVRLYGDCQLAIRLRDEARDFRDRDEADVASFERMHRQDTVAIEKLQAEVVEAQGHVRNGDDNIQRLEAERDALATELNETRDLLFFEAKTSEERIVALQRVEAERDEAWQEATAAAGARDGWQQTAGELQADRDEWKGKADIAGQAWADGNRTIERYEARIKALEGRLTYLQESLAAAQKNDKRGPDGRFRKVQ